MPWAEFSGIISYEEMRSKALQIEDLYRQHGLPLHPESDLARHIRNAKHSEDMWADPARVPSPNLYHGIQIVRIADALATLSPAQAPVFLRIMKQGSLEALERHVSHAKDLIWEMELCEVFRNCGIDAHLEEPDIVLKGVAAPIGVACKKLYSVAGISKVFSKANKQIKECTPFGGCFAINIEELQPRNKIGLAKSISQVSEKLEVDNRRFKSQYDHLFQKYYFQKRCMLVIVANFKIALISGVPSWTRNLTVFANDVYLPPAQAAAMKILRNAMKSK
jgi:hypothetical protein